MKQRKETELESYMDRDERTERRGNNGKLKRDAKVAKEGMVNRGAKKGRKTGAREKLLSTSQVVIRPRFVFT